MADKQMINYENASNPVRLVDVLTAMDGEIDLNRTLSNELKADMNTNKAVLDEIKAQLNAVLAYLPADGIINATVLSEGTTDDHIANTMFDYMIDGVSYHKAADAVGMELSAADTVNTAAAAGSFWGGWRIQIDAAGTFSTKSVGADQVYATEALAIAAIPAVDAANVEVGYVTVQSNDTDAWIGNTDDFSPGGADCLDANFYPKASSIPAAVAGTPAATSAADVTEKTTAGK